MSFHKDHGLLIFVDVSPSELFTFQSNSKKCMAAAMIAEEEGIPKLKQFKSGTWAKKMEHANNLIDFIENDKINIRSVGFITKESTVSPWIQKILNEALKKLGGEWVGEEPKYLWNDYEYSLKLILGVCAHVIMLSFVGVNVAHWLKKMKIKKASFLLDRFPANPEKALLLSEGITRLTSVKNEWNKSSKTAFEANFTFANLNDYSNSKSKSNKGKNHPHFIIVDWMAVSMRANVMPESFLDGHGNPRPQEDINIIASIWNKLKEKKKADEINLDDPIYLAKIKEFEKNRTESKT